MKSEMMKALYRISLLTSPDPEAVFNKVLEAITQVYGDTMAMLNVLDEDCIQFRSVVNPHPAFTSGSRLKTRHTLCQFALKTTRPFVIQNAEQHPEFRHHIVVKLKLNRYLGVPVCTSSGVPVGTLCFLDNRTDEILGEHDIQFLSMLAMRVGAELEREQILQDRSELLAEHAREKRERGADASRFKAFFDCTADAIISFDREGRMTSWNGGAERIFGYSAEEAIGRSYTLIGTQEVYSFQHQVFSETLRGDVHQWYDTRRRHKNGSIIDVSITTSPLILDGEVIGLVAIVRDISEKVRAARELKERNVQLDALAEERRLIAQELAEANKQLKANAEEKRHFVNMVMHDLRHPLTAIQTTLHLLRCDTDEQQRNADIAAIENRMRALKTLLDELVVYDQIEAGRSITTVEAIDIASLIDACVEDVSGPAGMKAVPIRREVAPDLGDVYLDRRKLCHILVNLISNALKFTYEGSITIRAYPHGAEQWRLEVEDTGIGMSSAERERAFEEYFSGAKRDHGGIGLGLTIAHRLSEALHGKVMLQSTQGAGSCFQLVFPRRLTDTDHDASSASASATNDCFSNSQGAGVGVEAGAIEERSRAQQSQ